MTRNLPHFILTELGKPHPFQPKGGGGRAPSDVLDRRGHAQSLLSALDALPTIKEEALPGLYLEVAGRMNERLKSDSLDSSGLSLLRMKVEKSPGGTQQVATVFASDDGVEKLRKKIQQYRDENGPAKERGGEIEPGRPKNANLVQSISSIIEAGLVSLWRSPLSRFPKGSATCIWEVWIEPDMANDFINRSVEFGVRVASDRLYFPEDTVVVCEARPDQLALAIRRLAGVRALAAHTTSACYFDGLDATEQSDWVDNIVKRTIYSVKPDTGYITLLDTGINRSHPLIQPALASEDRHAANPAWGLDDVRGHGTQLAGLSLFGDLTLRLQEALPIHVGHRLESVKLLPDVGSNPHFLLGTVTRQAVNAVELTDRRRVFVMATTTSDDSPHDGAPTSWSAEIDQLASGVSGDKSLARLIVISAGNINPQDSLTHQYLDTCDHPDSEIESPAHAWNSICVGAYTEKSMIHPSGNWAALAPMGELSPSSRTASWSSQWPIKPDVVLEGGNWATCNTPPPMTHGALSLLTTDCRYPIRSFSYSHDTSAATALAAKQITELWAEYPGLWPETIRGLYVMSARWNARMLSHLPINPSKGAFGLLFKRYGYGVPDMARARRSASNALSIIVQDEMTPYTISSKSDTDKHNEMRLFELPWPIEELRKLGDAKVTLRIALSSFIRPNPSEALRGSRYRYASHNLRFKLNRPNENSSQFLARISQLADPVESLPDNEDDAWTFGATRRDVGSLHIDQLVATASDLARRNLIAVHPVAGWWKSKKILKAGIPSVRFALIIEIDAEETSADIYGEISTRIKLLGKVPVAIA